MNRNNILYGAIVILIFVVLVNYDSYVLVEEVPIYVKVGERYAIDLDTSRGIYFPEVLPGMKVSNGINVINKGNRNKNFKIEIDGPSFISLSETNFMLSPNETKEIRVILEIPQDSEGIYEGTVLVYSNKF